MSKPHISSSWATLYSDVQDSFTQCFTLVIAVCGNYFKITLVCLTIASIIIFCKKGSFFDFSVAIVQLYSRLWGVLRKKIERIHILTPKQIWISPGCRVATGTCSIIRKKFNQIRVCLLGISSERMCLLLDLFSLPSQCDTPSRSLKDKIEFG